MPVNSLISAPATKPLFLAEITTTPRGRSLSSAASRPSSSLSTLPESTLAELPGLSIVSQAIASESRSSFQDPVAVSFMMSGRRDRARRGIGADLEIAHQWAMIREAHVRHTEVRDLDAFAYQDEVELDARHARWKGGESCGIGAAQTRRAHEEVDLVRAPEGVEVTRHDHRLRRLHDQIVQRAQLVLPLPELERQVHEEHAQVRQLQLDDQPLDSGIEVVEALAMHVRRGQEGVALLAHDGHELVDRAGAVLALEGRIMAELSGDVLRLVEHPGADRAAVHFDQSDDIRALGADELGDAAQHLAVAAQVTRARHRQVKGGPGAGGVADVVDEQSHSGNVTCRSVAAGPHSSPRRRGLRERRGLPAREFRPERACARLPRVSQSNPVRIFVTHAWENSDEYLRVFEYLESQRNFFYRNYSTPDRRPQRSEEALRENLRQQITPAEAIIALSSLYQAHQDLLTFQLRYAQASHKPVILLKPFGAPQEVPKALLDLADEVVEWDERALVDAIRRQARHEETTRWDTIEFKLD